MANTEMIDAIVSDSALKSLDTLNVKLISSYTEMENLLAKVQVLSNELTKPAKAYIELSKLTEEQKKLEKDLAKAIADHTKVVKEMEELKKKVIQTNSKEVESMQNVTKSYADNSKAVIENAKTLKDISSEAYDMASKNIENNRKNLVTLQIELKSYQEQLSKLDDQYNKNLITEDAYINKKAELMAKEQSQKVTVKALADSIKYENQILSTAIGTYDNASAQYSRLKIQINQMTDAEKHNGYTKAELEAQAKSLYEEMSRLQKVTGKHQLEVGQYDKAVTDLTKTLSIIDPRIGAVITKLQKITPLKNAWIKTNDKLVTSLGLSARSATILQGALIALIVGGIYLLVQAYKSWKEEQDRLNEVQRKFIEPITEEYTKVKILFDRLKDATKGTKEYANAKQQIIDNYGKLLEGQRKEIRNLEDQEAAYKLVTKAVIENARAKGLQSAIEETTSKFTESWSDALKGVDRVFVDKFGKEEGLKKFRQFSEGLLESGGELTGELKQMYDEFTSSEIQQTSNFGTYTTVTVNKLAIPVNNASAAFKKLSSETEYANIIFGKLTEKIEENNGAIGIQEQKLKDLELEYGDISKLSEAEIESYNKKKQAIDTEISRLKNLGIVTKELLKTQKDLIKQREKFFEEERKIASENKILAIQIEAEKQKEISMSETEYFENRLSAATLYSEELKKSIEASRTNQLSEVKRQMDELGLTEEQGREHILLINQKADAELIKLDRETSKLRLDITKDLESEFIKNGQDAISKRGDEVNKAMQKDLITAAKAYETAMKSANSDEERNKITEDYQKQRVDIIRKYNQQAFEEEVKYLENILELTDISENEKQKIREKIDALRKKNAQEIAEFEVDQLESSAQGMKGSLEGLADDIERILNDKRTKAILETWSTVFDTVSMYYDMQLEKIDELEKREKEYYDDKIKLIDENLEAGLMSEEEADARKRILEETQLDREQQLEQQRKEMQRKQAVWNKANSIVQTTIAGAQAFAVALTAGPILGPILAGIVAGMVAAQIAMITAQQIPAYAKGTDYHQGGLARVGDGGRSEMVIFPTGEVWKTPDTDTFVHLPRGTEVLPDYKKAMMNMSSQPYMSYYDDDSGKMIFLNDEVLRNNTKEANNQLSSINRGINAIRYNNIYSNRKNNTGYRFRNNSFN